ncbi:hypothetical protein SUNI508_11896 [Seiridium unicorne]|uniref:Uncharacterized protein n=1 Tax=Seiridium unicorne TaxID=138068 RepID=A0ABR2UGE3_9PEZI
MDNGVDHGGFLLRGWPVVDRATRFIDRPGPYPRVPDALPTPSDGQENVVRDAWGRCWQLVRNGDQIRYHTFQPDQNDPPLPDTEVRLGSDWEGGRDKTRRLYWSYISPGERRLNLYCSFPFELRRLALVVEVRLAISTVTRCYPSRHFGRGMGGAPFKADLDGSRAVSYIGGNSSSPQKEVREHARAKMTGWMNSVAFEFTIVTFVACSLKLTIAYDIEYR